MATTYKVEILHHGKTHHLDIPDDRTVLDAALEAGLDLPTSCGSGVCTTCAAYVRSGKLEQVDNIGISPEVQEKGYALLCVSYARADSKIETEKEDEVYEFQFGQYQK